MFILYMAAAPVQKVYSHLAHTNNDATQTSTQSVLQSQTQCGMIRKSFNGCKYEGNESLEFTALQENNIS